MQTRQTLKTRSHEMRAETAPSKIEAVFSGQASVVAASGDGAARKPPRFEMLAYGGGPIRPNLKPPLPHPIIVDLAGMDLKKQQRPALKDHDSKSRAGHTDSITTDGRTLNASGIVSTTTPAGKEVLEASADGFNWPVSLGADLGRIEFLKAGMQATVNGRTVTGPVFIARESRPREISFLTVAADDDAEARIAASAAEGNAMTFDEWLKQKKLSANKLSKAQRVTLEAAFKAEQANADDETTKTLVQATLDGVTAQMAASAADKGDAGVDSGADASKDASSAVVTELKATLDSMKREQAVYRMCGEKHVDLAAKAIEKRWDDDTLKLAIEAAELRASLPSTLQIKTGTAKDSPATQVVLEAALCQSLNLPNIEKQFKANELEAAHGNYRNIGLQQVMMIAAVANGYRGSIGERIHQGNIRDIFQYAFMQAGPSTVSLPGIFANTANKELLAGYMEEDQSWRELAQVKSVRDFKQVTSYRLLDNMEYEELPPGGQIKHGQLDEESYTRQAKTYAKMFALDRTDIINDDLGALDDLRARLGRGAAIKFNKIFWTAFVNNSTFFTTARANYITGSTTNLGTDGVGLALGIKAFRTLRSPAADGRKRIGGTTVAGQPDRLIVPPELEGAAMVLYKNQNLGAVKSSDANIYQNLYRPVVVPFLSDSDYTGYSATAWYLMRNPSVYAAIVVSFLNGLQTPTVESTDADFNRLGIQFRGYHDFGSDMADYVSGIKSKGAA